MKHYYGNNIYQGGQMKEVVDEVNMYQMTRLGNGVIWGKIGEHIRREQQSLTQVSESGEEEGEDYLSQEQSEGEEEEESQLFL